MNQPNYAIVGTLLEREFPDVFNTLVGRIKSSLPEHELEDLSLTGRIIEDFAGLVNVPGINWRNGKEKISCRINEKGLRICSVGDVRILLVAVLLMFYHPSRLYKFTNEPVRSGLIKNLSALTGISTAMLSYCFNTSIAHFKAYKMFYDEVNYVYQALVNKHDYFKSYAD